MAGKVVISKEYKDHPAGYRVKRVRCGSQFCGEIREYPDKKVGGRTVRVYWAARLPGEHIQTIPGWTFDKAMLNAFSEQGCCITHIGVMVTANVARRINQAAFVQETWLATVETFRAHRVEWSYDGKPGRFGTQYWALPLAQFSHKARELDDEAKIKEMRVGRK